MSTQLTVTSLVIGQPYGATVAVGESVSGYSGSAQFFDPTGETAITESVPMTQSGTDWAFTFPAAETVKLSRGAVMLRVLLVSADDAQKGEATLQAG